MAANGQHCAGVQDADHAHLADNINLNVPGGMVDDGISVGLFVAWR
jgi:hypothetical protein